MDYLIDRELERWANYIEDYNREQAQEQAQRIRNARLKKIKPCRIVRKKHSLDWDNLPF